MSRDPVGPKVLVAILVGVCLAMVVATYLYFELRVIP